MEIDELTGGCHCGCVRYLVHAPVDDAFFCHCRDCRRSAGAPYVAWGRIKKSAFVVTRGTLAEHKSSREVTRGFCPDCGAGITYEHRDYAPDLDFLLVTLDEPEWVTPTYHLQVAEKLSWVELGDSLPKYARWRPSGG